MKISRPPQLLRVAQLPLLCAVTSCLLFASLMGAIPPVQAVTASAVTVSILSAAAFIWSGSNLLALIFLLYVSLVFLAAYPHGYMVQGAVLFLIIMLGFWLGRTIDLFRTHTVEQPPQMFPNNPRLPPVLIFGLSLKCGTFVYTLASIGPRAFYSGAFMAQAIQNYASGSSSGLLLTAIGYIASILCVAGIGIYVESGGRSRFLIGFVLIGFPLLVLGRADLVAGGICLCYIFRKTIRVWHIAVIAGLALVGSVAIGSLRQSHLDGGRAGLSTIGAIAGELSVAESVHLIDRDIHTNGTAEGMSLIGPLVTMPIPRAIYPDKPLLTSARIMMKYFPEQAENGFYLAPTIFGDWLYNFGYPGLLIVSLLLALIIRRIDKSAISFLGVVFSYSMFVVLRNNTAQSFLFVAACWTVRELHRFRIMPRTETVTASEVIVRP